MNNFEYLDPETCYFDSACQTLRPAEVIASQKEYFQTYNACGGRTAYAWGERVDAEIASCRREVIESFSHSTDQYFCAFTVNTTYGINLVLSQLARERFSTIVTSDIEHNSVLVPTIAYAKRNGWRHRVLKRNSDGTLHYTPEDLSHAVIVLNAMSNFDGRRLSNIAEIVRDAHMHNSIVLIDAAQAIAHDHTFLNKIPYDGLFFSGHKAYSPSLGVMVLRNSLPELMDFCFLGGGTVEDVQSDSYILINDRKNKHALFEAGLQDFAGIIGLRAALSWRKKFRPENQSPGDHQEKLARLVFSSLQENPHIVLVNKQPSPIISFYAKNIDSHQLAIFLSERQIMVRSGYFCCHYYLKNEQALPPLLRISIGLHNTKQQMQKTLESIHTIIHNTY